MENLLLLHGALGAASQFSKLTNLLEKDYIVHTLNFSGHGGQQIPAEPFSISMFAENISAWIDKHHISNINIFGYSMGGYAALYLAKNHPERINKIFTLATKFEWTEEIAAREIKMLDAEKIKEKVPKFAEELKARHGDWETVLTKTAEMMVNLGSKNELALNDCSLMETNVQIGIGDSDKMVTLEESIAVYRALKNSSFIVLPDTPHPLEQVDMNRLSYEIKNYFG